MKKHTLTLICILFCLNIYGQDWQWLNPKPQGDDISSIVEIGTTGKLIGVTWHGSLVRSNGIALPFTLDTDRLSNNTLECIYFYNNLLGFAGGSEHLFRTEDGGGTWTEVSIPDFGFLGAVKDIHFLNSDTGFLAGDFAGVYKTEDGGLNWTKTHASNLGVTNAVYFVNAQTGFAGGINGSDGYLIKSTDGGATWTDAITPISNRQISNITFSSIGTGFAFASGDEMYKTVDTGGTWTKIDTILSSHAISDAFFISEDTGFATYNTHFDEDRFLRTYDAGDTWEEVWLGLSENSGYGRIYNTIFAKDAANIMIAGGGGFMYHTSDSGQSFSAGHQGFETWMQHADFAGKDSVFAVGLADSLFVSTDGGITWDIQALNLGIGIMKIKRWDSNKLFLLGADSERDALVAVSNNGGTSFNTYTIDSNNRMFDFHVIDENTLLACGLNLSLYRSTDGGVNWSNVSPVSANFQALQSFSFVTSSLGYCVGDSGVILKTIDSGANWTIVKAEEFISYNAVQFVSVDTGYISNSSSQVFLKTTNGGNTWSDITPGFFFSTSIIAFSDKNNGVVFSNFGSSYITNNGGANWSEFNSGTSQALSGVKVFEDNTMYLYGFYGAFLKTEDFSGPSSVLAKNNIHIQLYPNPVNQTLLLKGKRLMAYQIIDLGGKTLVEGEISGNLAFINVEKLEPGAYVILVLQEEKGISSGKFVKL